MCEPISMGIMAGVAVAGAGYSAYQQIKKSGFDADVARMNAKFAEDQAGQEVLAGETNAEIAKTKAGQFSGSQKAQFAGAGVDVSAGSALDVLADTRIMSDQDVKTIQSNSQRRAYGYMAQAANDTAAANEAESFGKWEAARTLIGGAASAASYGIKGYGAWKANGGHMFPANKEAQS